MPAGLPFGKRSPRGRLRWYLAQVPEGRERDYCDRVKALLPSGVLEDAFVVCKERWFRSNGSWELRQVQLYPGYFFVTTSDAAHLSAELSKLSFPVRLAGAVGKGYMPLALEAQEWFSSSLDSAHVLCNSEAQIIDGRLVVSSGPLVGQESRVSKIDRHRRLCTVRVCDEHGGFAEQMPIEVPLKS